MSSDHPHIDPTEGIEDVELEDSDIEDASFEELVKQRESQTAEAVSQYREAISSTSEGGDTSSLEKSEGDSAEQHEPTLEVNPPQTDGEIIKRTGIARLNVDLEDEDDEAMRDLIKESRAGEVETGFETDSSGDPVFDSIRKGTSGVRETFHPETPLSELPPGEQATELAKEATDDVNVDAIVEDAAELPKSPSAVREQVYEKVYSDITKFVRTIYSETEVNTTVLKGVREKIASDAARRAMVRRKANEDGVTVDADGYDPEEDGEHTVEEETQSEASDGGETDAPETEGDSEDVDLDGDVDLEG